MLKKAKVLLLIALLAACATAPVQEMSDARQALTAARDAGVDQHAPDAYKEAEALIVAAEAKLKVGDYGQAREHALLAKEKLMTARNAIME